jgi:hypothetical protein
MELLAPEGMAGGVEQRQIVEEVLVRPLAERIGERLVLELPGGHDGLLAPPSTRSKRRKRRVQRSKTPWKSGPEPIGQSTGLHGIPSTRSISSISWSGSRPRRSSLLMKVTIGTRRIRHTSNNSMGGTRMGRMPVK